MRFISLACATAITVAGLAVFPGAAKAESDFSTSGSAEARLDFRVTIPSVLFLQVSTGSFPNDVTDVDEIAFEPTPAEIEAGGAVSATAGSGDVGNGVVTVRVFGNNGPVTLSSAATLLASGADQIPWDEIGVTSVGGITHPAFDATGNTSTILATNASGRVTNLDGTWEYSFLNTDDQVASGEYTGTVTYTASTP